MKDLGKESYQNIGLKPKENLSYSAKCSSKKLSICQNGNGSTRGRRQSKRNSPNTNQQDILIGEMSADKKLKNNFELACQDKKYPKKLKNKRKSK